MIDGLAKEPPHSPSLTDYDRAHLKLYLRLLDAAEERADWREVVRILFNLDPDREPESARHIYEAHLQRAKWMSAHGYKDLLRSCRSED